MEKLEQETSHSEPAISCAVGSLRPKRRWKIHSTIPLQEREVVQLFAPVSGVRRRPIRMKKSGQPHQIFPEFVRESATVTTPAAVPTFQEVVGILRSFSSTLRHAS